MKRITNGIMYEDGSGAQWLPCPPDVGGYYVNVWNSRGLSDQPILVENMKFRYPDVERRFCYFNLKWDTNHIFNFRLKWLAYRMLKYRLYHPEGGTDGTAR